MSGLIANLTLSQLLIVDMQVKLCAAMPVEAMQSAAKNCGILAQAAHTLEIPILATEQYPQGLGATIPEVSAHFTDTKIVAKTAFSACKEPKFNAHLHRDKSQIILAGMEAHICVLQTALDLTQLGKQVFLVEDAVVSRDLNNKTNAINRLRDQGCMITNTESVLFEWLGNASHPAFKTLSKLIK